MHLITSGNYEEALDAVRDILLTYEEMASGYEGFGHACDVHVRFDPLKFIDAETDGRGHYVDMDLLRAGSAVIILCAFYDLWCEEQGLNHHPRTQRYQAAYEAGRLRPFSDIEEIFRAAIARDVMPLEDGWFDEAVLPIYQKYVLGHFARLAGSDRSASALDPDQT